MNNRDFVSELGCLGFTMRLKRISDALIHDGRRMYREMGLDIEPNWYVIFRLLKREGRLTVTEIADRILWAHPSVIAITNKMIKAGYLHSIRHETDNRKRELDLTKKAEEMLPQFERIWDAGERGVIQALKGTDAMEIIATLEERFFSKGFRERTIEQLNNKDS